MDGFFGSHPDGTHREFFFGCLLGFTTVAFGLSWNDGMNIAHVPKSASIQEWDAKPNTDFIDVVPGFDVVEGKDEEAELFEEANG